MHFLRKKIGTCSVQSVGGGNADESVFSQRPINNKRRRTLPFVKVTVMAAAAVVRGIGSNLSKNLREVRLHLCQISAASQGTRCSTGAFYFLIFFVGD